MTAFVVAVFSHHFVVSGYDKDGKAALVRYAMQFAEYTYIRRWTGEFSREMTRIYAAATRDRREMRFHIAALNDFKDHIRRCGYAPEAVTYIEAPMFEPLACELKLAEWFVPRPHQPPVIRHMVEPGKIKVVTLQTGAGKTASTLAALSQIGQRTVIAIRAQYVERWLDDLLLPTKQVLLLNTDDVMLVRGSKDLIKLIQLARSGELIAKIIIITGKTLYAFYDHYEKSNGDTEAYGCHPVEFYAILRAGVRVIDEVHQDFHFNFTQDLYTHIPKTISLSATLETKKAVVGRMYQLVFPKDTRADTGVYDCYIAVRAVMYSLSMQLQRENSLRYKRRGLDSYSHTDFEASILKNPILLRKYLELIYTLVYKYYIEVREDGQRLLVFAATVEMCDAIVKDLSRRHPDLKITRFTAGVAYNELLTSDITVSTLIKSGTAVDIPGLRVCLSTTAVDSTESNLQAMGRLRNLKNSQWPSITPEFIYMVCSDIPPHMRYHRSKQDIFKGKVLSHQVVDSGISL